MVNKPTVLVVDDEEKIQKLLALNLRNSYRVIVAGNVDEAVAYLEKGEVDLVLTDLKLPGEDGIAMLKKVKVFDSSIPVVLMTAYGTVENAVEAMKLGAFDYLLKPVKMKEVVVTVQKALSYRFLLAENRRLKEQLKGIYSFENIVCVSPRMQQILKLVKQVAESKVTVLIQGETGTGKELIARMIHRASPRASKPFVAVNCSAIPEELLESEFFGHEKGAFTSAVTRKKGKFELADGGSLFLDEVSEMPLSLQPKLLRVLEEQTFTRVGGVDSIQVDVRLIAATNRDLQTEVESGRFRKDLYYRLKVVPIVLPPLRERREDIASLVRLFLKKHAGNTGSKVAGISREALSILENYHWPGNVRELENVILRAMVVAQDDRIEVEHLPDEIRGLTSLRPVDREGLRLAKKKAKQQAVYQVERQFVLEALKQSGGNISQAARKAMMDRRQFQAMMKRCKVSVKELKNVTEL
ncbi:sigma-54-dependent Fis family transcriptional regulator [bacterium]|nr:sigma-54-dependent Fis family transcriptional regulator [bacterium]